MANQLGCILTLTAGAAFARGRFLKMSSGKVILCTAGDEAVGVSSDDAAADGDPTGVVMIDGATIKEIEAGEAIAVGDLISSDATGRAATSTSGDTVAGYALSAASAAGEFVEVLLQKQEAVA